MGFNSAFKGLSMFRIKKNKAVSVASLEICLEVNAEKTGCMYSTCPVRRMEGKSQLKDRKRIYYNKTN